MYRMASDYIGMRYDMVSDGADPRMSAMFVRSVEKALLVLRAFDSGRRSMSLGEIATSVGISKSAAQRFTYTLETLGYLRKDPSSRRWSLTPRTLDIGSAYLATDTLIETANPYLVDLNQDCRESVNMSEPDGADMIFLARFTSHSRTFVHMPFGTRIPMFCTASGRAYLSTLPAEKADEILRSSDFHPFTPSTEVDPETILQRVDAARSRGFATAAEEFYVGDLNIAAPIVGPDGVGIGAINISCPTARWTIEKMEAELAPLLVQTARKISSGPNARIRQTPRKQQGNRP